MTTTIAMIRWIWLACAVVGHHRVLEFFASFCALSTVCLHQVGDISGGLDGAGDDDFALRLLGPYGLLIGGQEALARSKKGCWTTTSNSRSSASPRSLLKTSFSEASVFAHLR